MKKIFLLAFLVIMGLILLNRQRVFVRDPLASVYRTAPGNAAATKQSGTQVYINYSNDVLLLNESNPGGYSVLVQHWNEVPGTPAKLRCMHWMACLTDADHATTLSGVKGGYDPQVQMTDREVSYSQADGARMRVQLR